MNSAPEKKHKWTRLTNKWTANEEVDPRFNYDDLFNSNPNPRMESLDAELERQYLENGIKLAELEAADERNSFCDKPEEDQFNKCYNTEYTKKEIDKIYMIADLYAVKTKDAMTYDSNCHTCGDELTNDLNTVYCSQECYDTYDLTKNANVVGCFWGDNCKMCHGYQLSDPINCGLCETQMASYDGYTLSNMTTVCVKCYEMSSDCDIYSDEEIECLDEDDEAAIEYLDEDDEGQSDPFFILPSREPYKSQQYYEDMKNRLELRYPDKKDDPEFKKQIDVLTYNIRQCEEDSKIQFERFELERAEDRSKRIKEFFKGFDPEDMDYHEWLKEQKELHKDDSEFQKNLAMFTYNNNPDIGDRLYATEDAAVLNTWPEDDDWNSRSDSIHSSIIEKPELKPNNQYYISSDEDEMFSPLRRTDSIRLDDEVLSIFSSQNASGIEESMIDTLNRLYDK
jgi:hypothetical protein